MKSIFLYSTVQIWLLLHFFSPLFYWSHWQWWIFKSRLTPLFRESGVSVKRSWPYKRDPAWIGFLAFEPPWSDLTRKAWGSHVEIYSALSESQYLNTLTRKAAPAVIRITMMWCIIDLRQVFHLGKMIPCWYEKTLHRCIYGNMNKVLNIVNISCQLYCNVVSP